MTSRSPSAVQNADKQALKLAPLKSPSSSNSRHRLLWLISLCVGSIMVVAVLRGGTSGGEGSNPSHPTPFPTAKPYIQYRYDTNSEGFKKSQVDYFGVEDKGRGKEADVMTPLLESVYTTRRKPVWPAYKGTFNKIFQIVEDFSDKVCVEQPKRDRSKAPPSILPRCPLYETSAEDKTILKTKRDFSFGDGSLVSPSSAELTSAMCARRDNSTWDTLDQSYNDMLSIKLLRLLITNSGCDDILPPNAPHIQTEFFKPIREEYYNEWTVLNYGSGCGHNDQFFTEYLSGVGRINVMGIDHRGEVVANAKAVRAPAAREALSRSHFQPSTIQYCHSKQGIEWIPSDTFNAVLAFDRFRSIPAADMCATVAELIRVTKIGGNIWIGHIEDPEQVKALTECKIPVCEGFSVEMSKVRESMFLSRMKLPDTFLAPKPYSFTFRKETTTYFEDISDINRSEGGVDGAPKREINRDVEDLPPPDVKGAKSVKVNLMV